MGPGEWIGKMSLLLIAMKRMLAYSDTFINLKRKLPESYIIAHPSQCAKDFSFQDRKSNFYFAKILVARVLFPAKDGLNQMWL